MLFNSPLFLLLFLPLTFLGFVLFRGAFRFLVLASLIFYSWWNPWHVLVFLASVAVNHALAHRIRFGLVLGILFNLSLLAYFKYGAFLSQGWIAPVPLPLGISFFTFQQIMYLVDVKRGKAIPGSLVDHLLFLSFFPHFIAGPLVRYQEILPQFKALKRGPLPWDQIAMGLTLLAAGLAKKVLLADALGQRIEPIFGLAELGESLTMVDAWSAALGFTLQLYFDFSGYSDMALGLAHLFGIRFPLNFDSPYRATSLSDFWRRWHITLSHFFRDYVYLPLGGRSGNRLRTGGNLLITMFLAGLWHGAGWTFIVWGTLHGLLLAIQHAWKQGFPRLVLPLELRWLLTFLCVLSLWVMFRAETFAGARQIYAGMVNWPTFGQGGRLIPATAGLWMICLLALAIAFPEPARWVRQEAKGLPFRPRRMLAFGVATGLVVCILNLSRITRFIYFEF